MGSGLAQTPDHPSSWAPHSFHMTPQGPLPLRPARAEWAHLSGAVAGVGWGLSGKCSREGSGLCMERGHLWGASSFPAPPAVSMATMVGPVLLGEELVGKTVDLRSPGPPQPL